MIGEDGAELVIARNGRIDADYAGQHIVGRIALHHFLAPASQGNIDDEERGEIGDQFDRQRRNIGSQGRIAGQVLEFHHCQAWPGRAACLRDALRLSRAQRRQRIGQSRSTQGQHQQHEPRDGDMPLGPRAGRGFGHRNCNRFSADRTGRWLRRRIDEVGHVAADGQLNAHRLIRARPAIILVEQAAQPSRLHPHDRVGLGVEVRRAAKDIHGDGICLDRLRIAAQSAVDDIAQKIGQLR